MYHLDGNFPSPHALPPCDRAYLAVIMVQNAGRRNWRRIGRNSPWVFRKLWTDHIPPLPSPRSEKKMKGYGTPLVQSAAKKRPHPTAAYGIRIIDYQVGIFLILRLRPLPRRGPYALCFAALILHLMVDSRSFKFPLPSTPTHPT